MVEISSRTLRRVGVLTGGGDVPGLNSVLRTLTLLLAAADVEVVGIRKGWSGLLHLAPGSGSPRPDDWWQPLDAASTRGIDRRGGTILHSTRLNPALLAPSQVPAAFAGRFPSAPDGRTVDATGAVLAAIEALRLDALVAIGGDGTLSFARRLHGEGVPVVAIPKTMDNDVFGTDYAIGFSTAVSRAVGMIEDLRTTAASHERILIVELFGRYSGEPCLLAAHLAQTDRALLAEVPFDPERIVALLVEDHRRSPSHYAVVAVAEGAHPVGRSPLESGEADAVGHKKLGGIGALLAEEIRTRSTEKAVYQPLGYLLRSGPPDALDRLVAQSFAQLAADHLLGGAAGLLTALVDGRYAAVDIGVLGQGQRRVDVERFYDSETYRPRIRDLVGLPMFLH
jgi:ATP-dependent phosphofructokinase / diphosphate-dependent phosphofructokinase